MKNLGGINLLFVAVLVLVILAGTGTAVSLSNSGGGTDYQEYMNKFDEIKRQTGLMLACAT